MALLPKSWDFEFLDWDLLESIAIIRATLAPLRLTRWQMFKYMVASIIRGTSLVTLIIIGAAAIGLFCVVLTLLRNRAALENLGLPVVGGSKQHTFDFERAVQDGKRLYPDSPYIIKSQGLSYVVYPSHVFNEIKQLPERIASARDFFVKAYFGEYTTAGKETATLLKTVSVDLARSIPIKVPTRQRDAAFATRGTIGECFEWKEVELFPATAKIIAQMNACSFLGRDLGRSEHWTKLVSKFPFEVMVSTFLISAVPRILQPLLAPLIYAPAIITKWRMKWAMTPVVKQDIEDFENAKDKKSLLRLSEHGKVPLTASLMSRYPAGEGTPSQILHDFITVSFESTPSSAAALYLVLRELALQPELVEILREELREVSVDGNLPQSHLAELRKMDSVLRESARLNPISLLALYRILRAPIQLSIGPRLPPGTIICCDVHHVNTSSVLWKEPQKFDGLRFFNLRKEAGMENKHQFVSTGADSPGWGDGSMACPGRMFANSTLKISLAHILTHYDFKFVDGQGVPVKTSLPNGSWNPGLDTRFLFKARKPA